MLGQHGDDGIPRRRFPGNDVEQNPELLVCISHLTVVRPARVSFPERGRWIVREVRVVDVHPQQEGFSRLPAEPSAGPIDHVRGPPLGGLSSAWHVVIVHGEPLVQPKAFFQHRRAHERRRIPSLPLQNRRQSGA